MAASSIPMLIGLWSSFELKLFLDHETDAINGEAIQSSSSGIGQHNTEMGWCRRGVNEVSCQDGSQDSTHDQNHWHLTAPTGSTADGVAAVAAASATTSAICNYLFMPALTLALGISKLPTKLVAGCRKLCRPRCPAAGHASLGVSYAMTNQYLTRYSGVSWRRAWGGGNNKLR